MHGSRAGLRARFTALSAQRLRCQERRAEPARIQRRSALHSTVQREIRWPRNALKASAAGGDATNRID